MITINNDTMKTAAYSAAAGGAIGAGAEFAGQKIAKRAYVKANIAENTSVPAKKSLKTFIMAAKDKATSLVKSAKSAVTNHYQTIAKSGKISKKAIGKSAAAAGIALPVVYLLKKAITSNKED